MADDDQVIIPPDLLRQISEGVTSEALTKENLGKVGAEAQNVLTEVVKVVFAFITVLVSQGVGPLIEGVLAGEKFSEGSYQRIAAKMLNSMLGANINPSDIEIFGESHSAAEKIGAAIFASMGTANGPVEPSDENAHKFVAMMANLTIEGWINGLIFETVAESDLAGLVKFEQVAQLKDALISAFGLSRISRRVFGPYVNAVVVQPFKWKVNKTYRPELLPLATAAKQFLRGKKTADRFMEEGARAGLADDDVEAVLNSQRQKLSIDDWLWLERYAKIDTTAVDTALADLGCDDAMRTWLRRLDFERRRAKYQIDIATEVENAYLDGHAEETSLRFALSLAYPDADEREARRLLVEAKKANRRKRLAHAEIKDAVTRGILSPFDYRDWLKAEGYDDDSATTLELLLTDTLRGAQEAKAAKDLLAQQKAATAAAKATADAERRAELEARQAAQIPPLSDIKDAVVRGLVPVDRYTSSLQQRGYKVDDIGFLTTALEQDRDARLHQEEVRREAESHATDRNLSLSQLDGSVLAGFIGLDEYDRRLKAEGFSDADRPLLVALLKAKLDEQTAAKKARDAADKSLQTRGLSLSQAEQATKLHVWTLDQFRVWLTKAGLDDVAVATLTATMDAELQQEANAEARREQIATELAVKSISLPQLEQAVLRGLATLADYRAQLTRAKYGPDDVELLAALLQTKVDAATAARAKQAEAQQRSSTRRLPLSVVERGVILGSVTIDAYDQFLRDLEYGDDDRAILESNLADELQAARELDHAHDAIVEQLGDNATAAGDLERDVVAGVADLDAYTALLRTAGVDEPDVQQCVKWLTMRVDQRHESEQLAGVVDGELSKARDLSLGQWHDAVKAGLRTLADFRAFLLQRYTLADADVLVALLDEQLSREASKAK